MLFYSSELFPVHQFVFDGNQVFVDLEDNDQQFSVDPCHQHAYKNHQWTADNSAKRGTKTMRLEGGDDTTEKHNNAAEKSHGDSDVEQNFDDRRSDHFVKIKERTCFHDCLQKIGIVN